MYDYTEFNKLVVALVERGHKVDVANHLNGKICKVDGNKWDFVINCASYGHEDGLVEVYGMEYLDDNDVEGYLSAFDVLERLDNPKAEKEFEDGDVLGSMLAMSFY